jgi:serine/threonine protein kinase
MAYLLGKGSYGKVYGKIYNDKYIADKQIKFIHNGFIQTSALIETSILYLCNHENIVKLIDVVPEDDTLNIIMEYGGKPVDSFFIDKEHKLNKMYNEIIDALQYLHTLGIYHVDIKRNNILYNIVKDKFILIDFSSSAFKKIRHEVFLSTYTYSPPETLLNNEYDEKSDLWSFGAVLFELLTGHNIYNILYMYYNRKFININKESCAEIMKLVINDKLTIRKLVDYIKINHLANNLYFAISENINTVSNELLEKIYDLLEFDTKLRKISYTNKSICIPTELSGKMYPEKIIITQDTYKDCKQLASNVYNNIKNIINDEELAIKTAGYISLIICDYNYFKMKDTPFNKKIIESIKKILLTNKNVIYI